MKKERQFVHSGGTPSLEQVFTQDGRALLTVRIRCPFEEPPKGRGMGRMARYYRGIFGAYQRYCTGRLLQQLRGEYARSPAEDGAFLPYEAGLDYRITRDDGLILSLYYERVEVRGGRTVCTLRYSDTWRKRSGKLLTLEELIENSGKRMLLQRVMQTVPLMGEQHFFPRWRKLVKKYLNVNRFFVRDDEVILYFQPGTISPFERGVQEFSVGPLFQQRSADGVIPTIQTL